MALQFGSQTDRITVQFLPSSAVPVGLSTALPVKGSYAGHSLSTVTKLAPTVANY